MAREMVVSSTTVAWTGLPSTVTVAWDRNPVPEIQAVVAPAVDPWVGKIDSTENDPDGDGPPGSQPQPGVMTTETPRLATTTRARERLRIRMLPKAAYFCGCFVRVLI